MSTCLTQLVERLKFKKAEHSGRGGVLGSSFSGDSLLPCNKVLSLSKKKKKSEEVKTENKCIQERPKLMTLKTSCYRVNQVCNYDILTENQVAHQA